MLTRFRRGLSLLPTAVREPSLAGRWLARSHRAQLVLVVAGALAIFVLPAFLDWALPMIYPPVKTQVRVLGIPAYSTSRPDPRVATRREQATAVAWVLWLGAVAVMLISELPNAIATAGAARPANGAPAPPATTLTVIESPSKPRPAGDATVVDGTTAVRGSGFVELPGPGVAHDSQVGRLAAAQRYRLTRELGRGGMGVVYLALDTVLLREVALKELPNHLGAQTELAQRFRQEARVLARLSHPCIVQVHDLIEDEGRMWIALEYVRGGTLAEALRRNGGALGWPETVRIGRQIADGLAFAHAQGVIHRDIKPMNVLLTDTEPPLAKLTDFGLARMAESTEHTRPGSVLGSARYLSPEQAAGRPADARSDLYAFGVTMFEMLSGQVPFDGEFAAVIAQHLNAAPPDLGDLAPMAPPALVSLIGSMLAKDPAARPADAGVVASELEQLQARAA